MYPVLFSYGPIAISSLGTFIAIGFIIGSFEIWRRLKQEYFDDVDIFDSLFISLFTGLIGARLVYIIIHFEQFNFDFNKWLNLGFSNQANWMGFLLGCMYGLRIISKRKKWSFYQFADLAVFGVILAQIFIRIGQFLDGSYVGSITNAPWAFGFPGLEGRRHPLQLYEIIFLCIMYGILLWLDKQYRLFKWYQDNRGEARPGFLWLTYIGTVTMLQFILDFITNARENVLISRNQLFLLGILTFVGIGLWVQSGKFIKFKKISEKLSSFFIKSSPSSTSLSTNLSLPLVKRIREKRKPGIRAGRDAK